MLTMFGYNTKLEAYANTHLLTPTPQLAGWKDGLRTKQVCVGRCGLFLHGIGHSEICSETQNKAPYNHLSFYLDNFYLTYLNVPLMYPLTCPIT